MARRNLIGLLATFLVGIMVVSLTGDRSLVSASLEQPTSSSATNSGSADTPSAGSQDAPPPGRLTDQTCPASYIEPASTRPRITLTFDVSDDLGTVRGTEDVQFTPDLPITELVFRLIANSPTAGQEGTSIRVDRAGANGGNNFHVDQAAAADGSQGGLLILPLDREVPAGEAVTGHVEFTLTLGDPSFERFGHGDGVAWFGSGEPLFAWERGFGWHNEAFTDFIGESATSEAATTDITVTAPASATVLTSGVADPPVNAGPGRRTWHSFAESARDVSVSLGNLQTTTRLIGTTTVTVGVPPGSSAEDMLADTQVAIEGLEELFGPSPFSTLTLAQLSSDLGGGIEYPGAIQMLEIDTSTLIHEVAHQWFYGLVGNSQARDPWLDEAFATYGEMLVSERELDPRDLERPGEVGASIDEFGLPGSPGYFATVYDKGAAALLAARQAVGADAFDAAIRCYINANAWEITKPEDVAFALRDLRPALDILTRAGALP